MKEENASCSDCQTCSWRPRIAVSELRWWRVVAVTNMENRVASSMLRKEGKEEEGKKREDNRKSVMCQTPSVK